MVNGVRRDFVRFGFLGPNQQHVGFFVFGRHRGVPLRGTAGVVSADQSFFGFKIVQRLKCTTSIHTVVWY